MTRRDDDPRPLSVDERAERLAEHWESQATTPATRSPYGIATGTNVGTLPILTRVPVGQINRPRERMARFAKASAARARDLGFERLSWLCLAAIEAVAALTAAESRAHEAERQRDDARREAAALRVQLDSAPVLPEARRTSAQAAQEGASK